MVYGDRQVAVRCYLDKDKARTERLSTVSAFLTAIDEKVYNRFSYAENELLVFGEDDSFTYLDLSVEEKPSADPLDTFLRMRGTDKAAAEKILSALSGFAVRHSGNGLRRGGISAGSFRVADETLLLTGLHRAERGECGSDVEDVAFLFCAIYLSASDERLLKYFPETPFSLLSRVSDSPGRHIRNLWERIFESVEQEKGLPPPFRELCSRLRPGLTSSAAPHKTDVEALLSRMKETVAGGIVLCQRKFAGLGEKMGKTDQRQPETSVRTVRYKFVGPMECMLMRAYDGTGWCYLGKDSRVRIPGPFLEASDFCEGLAAVETAEGFGVIDTEGNFVIAPHYEDVEIDTPGNRILVTREGTMWILSRTGETITRMGYDGISSQGEGHYVVQKGREYGYIDVDGRQVTPVVFDEASSFKNGKAQVRIGNREFFIGTDGKEIPVRKVSPDHTK